MPSKPLKMVLITDIHIGANKPCEGRHKRLPSYALSLLRYQITRINEKIRPDFVVQLGNLIEDEDEESDVENYSKAVDAFKQLSMPVHHVVGDCEQVNLNQKQICSVLSYPKLYYSFDSGAFHFVVLFSTATNHKNIHIDESQRKWLINDLAGTNKPTIVFTHYPLDDQDLTGSLWFEEVSGNCFVEERLEIREILARSGNVRAVFNGHVYRNNLELHDGICYVTLQSLVNNMSDSRMVASESIAIVILSDKEIRVEIEGMDPAEYRI